MNLNNFFRISFVILGVSLLWAWSNLRDEKKKNKNLLEKNSSLKKQFDSLENEIFVLELKLFRHERAYEIFEEKNPEASSQFSDIISDETE